MKKKLELPNITLLAATSVEIDMTQLALRISFRNIKFGAVKLLSSSLPKKKYSDISWPNIILIDLLYFFREEPILLKGLFNFGLKNVGKILYNNKLIKTTWEETDNGLDAVIRFKQICENKNKNIPLKRYNEIAEIINYNKIDCLVLTEILMFLRERYL